MTIYTNSICSASVLAITTVVYLTGEAYFTQEWEDQNHLHHANWLLGYSFTAATLGTLNVSVPGDQCLLLRY